jgi:hypothetical protein
MWSCSNNFSVPVYRGGYILYPHLCSKTDRSTGQNLCKNLCKILTAKAGRYLRFSKQRSKTSVKPLYEAKSDRC